MTRSTAPSARTKVRRLRELARYDRSTIHAILDEATVCHVGFVDEGQPFVIPTAIARINDHAYIHGSRVSRMLKLLAAGNPACVTVTLLDGIVVARSAFNSSMNYRSVTVHGTATLIEGDERVHALSVISEHVMPGRSEEVRPSHEKEILMTGVIQVEIESASAKISMGPPDDEDGNDEGN